MSFQCLTYISIGSASIHPLVTVTQNCLDQKSSDSSPNHSQVSRNSSKKSNSSLLVHTSMYFIAQLNSVHLTNICYQFVLKDRKTKTNAYLLQLSNIWTKTHPLLKWMPFEKPLIYRFVCIIYAIHTIFIKNLYFLTLNVFLVFNWLSILGLIANISLDFHILLLFAYLKWKENLNFKKNLIFFLNVISFYLLIRIKIFCLCSSESNS